MSRALAYGLGLGTVGAVLAPAFAAPGWDSYPLSSYPMFTQNREKPRLHFIEAVGEPGARERVAPELVANDEVMQAAVTIRRAAEGGPPALDALCSEVAARVAREGPRPGGERARELEIIAATFDPIRYFVDGPEPEQRVVLARCALGPAP